MVSAKQDPKIVAAIGPYEAWPPLDVEEGCGPLLVGTEGCLPGLGEPILWREIAALQVSRNTFGTVVADSLIAEKGPTALAPTAEKRRVGICIATVGAAFDGRARLLGERLQRYFLDNGVPADRWPPVNLEPVATEDQMPEPTRAIPRAKRGFDPILGEYVRFDPNPDRLAGQVLFGLALVGLGAVLWLLNNPIVALLAAAVGSWEAALATWFLMRPQCLLLGERGFRLAPDLGPLRWEDVERLGYERSFWLPGRLIVRAAVFGGAPVTMRIVCRVSSDWARLGGPLSALEAAWDRSRSGQDRDQTGRGSPGMAVAGTGRRRRSPKPSRPAFELLPPAMPPAEAVRFGLKAGCNRLFFGNWKWTIAIYGWMFGAILLFPLIPRDLLLPVYFGGFGILGVAYVLRGPPDRW
jgi:hypothetical protein